MNKSNDKHKAFLGALISSAVSLGSGIAGGIINRNRAKRQQRRQQIAQNKADTLEMAQNLSEGYSNQDYVDEFQKKVVFKNGGKYTDRIKRAKKFKCGGRKKFEDGGKTNTETKETPAVITTDEGNTRWTNDDSSNVISGIGSALGNLASSVIGNSVDTTIKKGISFASTPKTSIKVPDYVTNGVNSQYLMRCGGKAKKYKKIKK